MRKVDIPIYPDRKKCGKILTEAINEKKKAAGKKPSRRETVILPGEVCQKSFCLTQYKTMLLLPCQPPETRKRMI